MFCLFAAQTMAFVLIPLAAAGLGLSGVAIGVLVAMPAGLGLVSDVPVAMVSDRLGRRPPMVVGAGLGVVSGALLMVASDFGGLFVGSVALGLSLSLGFGPMLAYITEACLPKDAARVQGYT